MRRSAAVVDEPVDAGTLELKLYVSGQSGRSRVALGNLRRLLETTGALHSLSVIDVLEEPQAAERDGIVAAPTLVKSAPPPAVRIIGDLAATALVMRALGIEPRGGDR